MGERVRERVVAALAKKYILPGTRVRRVKLSQLYLDVFGRRSTRVLDILFAVPEQLLLHGAVYRLYLERTSRGLFLWLLRSDVEPFEWLVPLPVYLSSLLRYGWAQAWRAKVVGSETK